MSGEHTRKTQNYLVALCRRLKFEKKKEKSKRQNYLFHAQAGTHKSYLRVSKDRARKIRSVGSLTNLHSILVADAAPHFKH
jgi:hypothetical protein